MSATFSLGSWGPPPWQNPGSVPDLSVIQTDFHTQNRIKLINMNYQTYILYLSMLYVQWLWCLIRENRCKLYLSTTYHKWGQTLLVCFCLHANPLKLCASPPGVYLECLKVWGGKKRNFIVASRSGDSAGVANCFVSNKIALHTLTLKRMAKYNMS